MKVVRWMRRNVIGFWGGVTVIIALVFVADMFMATIPTGEVKSSRRGPADATRVLA